MIDLRCGDALEVLRTLPDESVQCVVTSPPYWGLRDYGVAGQIGLERTPGEYVSRLVEVFREVRRVLRGDGVLWLNLGDTYASDAGACVRGSNCGTNHAVGGLRQPNRTFTYFRSDRRQREDNPHKAVPQLKPKDLIGIPWSVAKALQQPYYTGRIKSEADRIWLAAMLDAEGCMFIHKRKAGQHNGQGYYRQNDNYGPGVEISNTSTAIVERILALVGQGSICSQGPDENARRKQAIYRWNLRTTECRDLVRELYPYLVGKQQQARILVGCPPSGEKAEAAHAALIALHRIGLSDVDFPAPASLYEPGYYLRSDVIWSKANPTPESVTDRPTKAHEYVFLLAKSERYYWDHAAAREAYVYGRDHHRNVSNPPASLVPGAAPHTGLRRGAQKVPTGWDVEQRSHGKYHVDGRRTTGGREARRYDAAEYKTTAERNVRFQGPNPVDGMRNCRSVWTIPTQPFPEAHFATFPEALVERCIAAGSRVGDAVLDPFCGSGTVGVVCARSGRNFLGIDLNPEYVEMARRRINGVAPLFAEVSP